MIRSVVERTSGKSNVQSNKIIMDCYAVEKDLEIFGKKVQRTKIIMDCYAAEKDLEIFEKKV